MYGILTNDVSERGFDGIKVKVLKKVPKGEMLIFSYEGTEEEFEVGAEVYLIEDLERAKGATFTWNGIVAKDIASVEDVSLIH